MSRCYYSSHTLRVQGEQNIERYFIHSSKTLGIISLSKWLFISQTSALSLRISISCTIPFPPLSHCNIRELSWSVCSKTNSARNIFQNIGVHQPQIVVRNVCVGQPKLLVWCLLSISIGNTFLLGTYHNADREKTTTSAENLLFYAYFNQGRSPTIAMRFLQSVYFCRTLVYSLILMRKLRCGNYSKTYFTSIFERRKGSATIPTDVLQTRNRLFQALLIILSKIGGLKNSYSDAE